MINVLDLIHRLPPGTRFTATEKFKSVAGRDLTNISLQQVSRIIVDIGYQDRLATLSAGLSRLIIGGFGAAFTLEDGTYPADFEYLTQVEKAPFEIARDTASLAEAVVTACQGAVDQIELRLQLQALNMVWRYAELAPETISLAVTVVNAPFMSEEIKQQALEVIGCYAQWYKINDIPAAYKWQLLIENYGEEEVEAMKEAGEICRVCGNNLQANKCSKCEVSRVYTFTDQ